MSDNSDDSDNSETFSYVDLNEIYNVDKINTYQIQIENENLIIKHIGNMPHTPDIIIKENFGPNLNLNLYSCVYSEEELVNNNKLFFPLVKYIKKNTNNNIVSCFAVKFEENINTTNIIRDWKLFWIKECGEEITTCEISKNINTNNIIESIIMYD